MIRTRSKKVLLVAPNIFPDQLLADYSNVRHVAALNNIFPAIFELTPDVIVFDHEFMGKEMESVLRRIKVNKFYSKIKICAYKSKANTKVDSLLKVLGVDEFIYTQDLSVTPKSKSMLTAVSTILDASLLKLVARVSG